MSILIPDIAIMEKILRSVVVYLFLLVSFRVAGKRLLGQLTAFDLVVLLIISSALQNALLKEGVTRVSEVRWALLEEGGHVSVVQRGAQPA